MKRVYSLFVLIGLLLAPLWLTPLFVHADSPKPEGEMINGGRWVEVRADTSYRPSRILPPQGLLEAQATTATFTINYLSPGTYNSDQCTTWPNDAKAAFTYAANIWGSLLSSPVPIVIDACWATNLPTGVLGHSGVLSFRANFTNAPQSNTWYPIALANSLYGSDLKPGEADIYIAYSSTFDWYFGTDGNTPSGKYDFVSVVLHEIAHGLGFSGWMRYGTTSCGASNYGCWGDSTYGFPGAYDRFMQNGSGTSLLNTASFPNPSAALGSQLTSNNLFFNGNYAIAANGGSRPKMYAPSSWLPGSSYAHLDYDTYKNTPHRLMVFAISPGASTHYPGSITLGILQDLGWNRPTAPSISKIYLPVTMKPQPGPDAGYWRTSSGSRYFYVSPDKANVNLYTITIQLSGGPCDGDIYRVWKTSPLPITNNQFSFSGALNGNGTFNTTTTATVTDRITNLYIEGCGTFSGGPWTNTFTWQNNSQPAALSSFEEEDFIEQMDVEVPSIEILLQP
ncbi:MAG: serine protease [Anaerolineae bacterium]|nr:MAG: serine protease [Anaerolineae bacterium]